MALVTAVQRKLRAPIMSCTAESAALSSRSSRRTWVDWFEWERRANYSRRRRRGRPAQSIDDHWVGAILGRMEDQDTMSWGSRPRPVCPGCEAYFDPMMIERQLRRIRREGRRSAKVKPSTSPYNADL